MVLSAAEAAAPGLEKQFVGESRGDERLAPEVESERAQACPEGLLTPGILAKYDIIERIGSGGLGVVFKALDRILLRPVALKTIRPDLLIDPNLRANLLVEAQAAARLNHPNIATVYEFGEDNGCVYMAMELIEGSSVVELVARGQVDVEEALGIALGAAEALDAAHRAGIIHCDIKSANIMVSKDGAVKVLDFGLAQLCPGARAQANRQPKKPAKRQTTSSGTLGYMSPEQLVGEDLDGRTDLFSLGVVLYEMLAGQRPFAGEDVATATISHEALPLGAIREGVTLEFEHIVRKLLAKNRDSRHASAEELIADLHKVISHGQVRTRHGQDAASETAQPAPSQTFLSSALIWCHRLRRGLLAGGVLSLMASSAFLFSSSILWSGVVASLTVALVFLAAFALQRKKPLTFEVHRSNAGAFRGLLPFAEGDRDHFFGRDAEFASLLTIISNSSHHFSVLYGESGCGKTSLLRAGVIPRLWDKGYVPLYCRFHKDPLMALMKEAQRQTGLAAKEEESVHDYLRRLATEYSATVVVVFDQFEEFFINFPDVKTREPFLAFVADCERDQDLPVKFVFSVRNDFLYLIATAFDGRVSEPLAATSRFALRTFSPQQALGVIESSVRIGSLPVEDGLCQQLVRDLTHEDRVLPSELQIVGDQLQQRRVFTLREYRALGGKEALVHGYLEDVIRCTRDQEGARLVLRSLVSDENTRLTLTAAEITERTQRNSSFVSEGLRIFVQARVLHEIQDEEPWRYEFVHEYLIDKVNKVAGKVMDARQRANRLLRQHLSHASVDSRARIPLLQLWFVKRYSDLCRETTARELMRKSLVRGIGRSAVLGFLLVAGGTFALALLSIREEWDERILNGGHTAAARSLAFSPDSHQLVSGGEDGRVLAWDFPRRELTRVVEEGSDWIAKVAYAPDGRYFATGHNSGDVRVWTGTYTKSAVRLVSPGGVTAALAFTPNSQMLLGQFSNPMGAIAWKVDDWRLLWRARGSADFGSFAFDPSRKTVINQSQQVNDLVTGHIEREATKNCAGTIMALSADGGLSVSLDGDGNVQFCDQATLTVRLKVHAFKDHGRAAVFSPDGTLVATAAEDILLWDTRTLTKLQRLKSASFVWDLRFSPDGAWLVSSHGNGSILVWNVRERELDSSLNGHSADVRSVAFSPDGRFFASASDDLSVIVWEAKTGRKLRVLRGHTDRVNAVTFGPDSNTLYSVAQVGAPYRWNWADTTNQPDKVGEEDDLCRAAYDLAVSPDGTLIATARGVYGPDGHLLLDRKLGEHGQPYGISFTHDGKQLAMGTGSGSLLLYEVGLDSPRLADRVISPSGFGIIDLAFAPDDKSLVTGDDMGEVWLWKRNPLRPFALLGRHSARVKSVAFSPDGRRVVSAGNDAMIALWDVRRRKQIASIGRNLMPVHGVAFSPSGDLIASTGADGTVRSYSLRRTLWGRTIPTKGWF